ncbi:MAG TPA: SgcJ/EcaC family oxidoreductase [Stellaceae bacterium]|nr:SgcJ/EcaC family oxidoreductase [Stellaceae bacterium]
MATSQTIASAIRHLSYAAICCALASGLAMPTAFAQSGPAAEIRAALAQWTAAFNARDAAAVCRLFAPDLRYDYRGLPPQTFREICPRLKQALTDPAIRRHYTANIEEILVSGDLGVVRLVWHLTTSRPGRPDVRAAERGMDIFRRQPDGSWKIIRFLAYEEAAP